MQLGTRRSIASIRLVLCAAFIACGLSAKVSAQEASVAVSAQAGTAEPAPVAAPAAVADAAPSEAPAEDELPWALQHRAYNTWEGGTGGFFMEDPGIGEPGSVRLQLGLSIYSGGDFFYEGDDVEQNGQSFAPNDRSANECSELVCGNNDVTGYGIVLVVPRFKSPT